MSRPTRYRAAQARRAARLRPAELHIVSFRFPELAGFRPVGIVLVRGRMGQNAAIGPAHDSARALGFGSAFCVGIRTVPAPRPTPALDAICRRHTAFASFLELLTAAAEYRPSIRLDLLGQDGAVLAKAYNRVQAAWGDPRRAFVTGSVCSK
jgi:hypothetical protein